MSLNINHFPVISIQELRELFEETYGYSIDGIREILFGDNFANDSYKALHLSWEEDDYKNDDGNIYWDEVFNNIRLTNVVTHEYDDDYNNKEMNFAKVVKLLRDQGIKEDTVLIDVSW